MSIKIKKSKQGSLHTHLGVPQGKKIPASKLKIKSTDSPAIKKKKQFAINARKWKHEDGGLIPEYSWGGVLAQTAAGAGTGAMVGGPWGAVIGGAGALIKGAIGEIQGNKEEQLKQRQDNLVNAQNNFNNIMGGGVKNPFTSTFAYGGMTGNINAEIEKGETSVSPDGRMRKFELPSHAQVTGDNFKYFDPGTMIFSDKLKFNKSRTFAQEQNRYKTISDKADKALKNPGSTFLNKRTAKLNKDNALKMSVDLFSKQEAMKMSKGGKIPKATDGFKVPMFNNIGYTGFGSDQYKWPNLKEFPVINEGNFRVPYGSAQNVGAPTTVDFDPMEAVKYTAPPVGEMNIDYNAAIAATDKNTSPVNYAKLANDFDVAGATPVDRVGINPKWGNIGMQALGLAPDIYNLGQALFQKPEKLERSRYFNPYTNQIRSRMNDRRFNIDPILAANRNANAVYNRNVTNAGGGDRSRIMSNLLAGMNARQGADAAAYSQKINMDNQYAAEQAQMDFGLGQSQAQALALRDDINARNLAAKRNYGAAAASGIQRYALMQQQMRNQRGSQEAYLDVLGRVNPFFNQWLGIDDLRNYNRQ